MRKFVLAGLWMALGLSLASEGLAATRYISDELAVPLRRGPSTSYKILHRGLPSGTKLEVLGEDEQAGFTHVRTQNGTEGWVPTQYLTEQPIARDRLAAANRRIESLEGELKSLRESGQQIRVARSEAEARIEELTDRNQKLEAEIAEIRRASASAIAQYEQNKQLRAANENLSQQVTQLSGQVRQLQRNAMLRWMLAGGGLVLAGLLFGVWLNSRRKRSVWA